MCFTKAISKCSVSLPKYTFEDVQIGCCFILVSSRAVLIKEDGVHATILVQGIGNKAGFRVTITEPAVVRPVTVEVSEP